MAVEISSLGSEISSQGSEINLAGFNLEGFNLEGLAWNTDSAPALKTKQPPIVMIHGWLDNAASFNVLGDLLAAQLPDRMLFAMDLPGHGKSLWKQEGADYAIWNYTAEVAEFAGNALKQSGAESTGVDLVAHSLGGSVALCLAAAFPELVRSLVILDSPGPLVTAGQDFAKQLRQGVEARGTVRGSRTFVSIDDAVAARLKATPQLSHGDMTPLVARNLNQQALPGGVAEFQWTMDPRLKIASKVRMSEDQVKGLMNAVVCPVLGVRAQDGILPKAMFDLRMAYLSHVDTIELVGHHHCHMESEAAQLLSVEIVSFLTQQSA